MRWVARMVVEADDPPSQLLVTGLPFGSKVCVHVTPFDVIDCDRRTLSYLIASAVVRPFVAIAPIVGLPSASHAEYVVMERWPDGRDSAIIETSRFCASYSSVLLLRVSVPAPVIVVVVPSARCKGGFANASSTTSATAAWRVTETDRNFLPVLSE